MRDGLDEVDVALLDAFHLNPRVSFEEVSTVVGVSAATAARRWRRLADSGRAWVSSAPGERLPVAAALFEAECEPGAANEVAERLAMVPQAFTVNLTSGRNGVYALVVAADQSTLARLLLDVLPGVGGLRGVETSPVLRLFSSTRWRLGSLTREDARAVAGERPAENARSVFGEQDRLLYLALQHDGRLAYRDLAVALGKSEAAVRRRVQRLVHGGLLTFRTDFARAEAGWPIGVAVKLRAAGVAVADVGRKLVQWPEVRLCCELLPGSANVFLTLQLHEMTAVIGLLDRLSREFPGIAVVDTRLVIRPVKSWGRVLDSQWHASAVVPVDLWAGPEDPTLSR